MTMPRGTLLAEDARTATTSAGPCAICGSLILHGHYIAPGCSAGASRTPCASAATWRQAAR
jgi:hypothetical protein